ncbi:MAG: hypothetical protein EPN93_11250 [Spirochaetes bacterium]|nr:MAG: hypothetical protein EPN93_11250 [Spirochaetota bacterium]
MIESRTAPVAAHDQEAIMAFMREVRTTCTPFRQSIQDVFGGVREFLISTVQGLDEFLGMIEPYVRYFYTISEVRAAECFLNDVVLSQRDNIDYAIDEAVRVMEADLEISSEVAEAIRKSFELHGGITGLLEIFEEIEIHALNTMIFSKKTGSQGDALARIATEMGALSHDAGSISTGLSARLAELGGDYKTFTALRNDNDITHQNYLTRIKIENKMIFRKITERLAEISMEVVEMIGGMRQVETSLRSVIAGMSIEDVIRQDFEKMLYLAEEVLAENGGLFERSRAELGGPIMERLSMLMLRQKSGQISRNIQALSMEIASNFARINEVTSQISARFGSGAGDTRGEGIDQIYGGIEQVKLLYVDFIEKIIADKDAVYAISKRILETMRSFGQFFDGIDGVTRRLEIITMITRIELSRHTTLQRELRGALEDVSSLPAKIKQVVAALAVIYEEVSAAMEMSVERYFDNSRREEGSLRNGVDAIKKVSVELFESRKYYDTISEKVAESRDGILRFVEDYGSRRDALARVVDTLSMMREKAGASLGDPNGDEREELKGQVLQAARVRDILRENAEEGDYRVMMLISLLNEIHEGSARESETIFF